ncbi:MAG: hypothetical protein AAB673_02460 [Patescibacteria group bacterium]
MKFFISNPTDTPRNLLRRCGYAEFNDPNTGHISYVRRLSSNFYPRYHVYATKEETQVIIDLHVDQKQPSYKGSHMHAGEYDGELVEREVERIKELLNSKPEEASISRR